LPIPKALVLPILVVFTAFGIAACGGSDVEPNVVINDQGFMPKSLQVGVAVLPGSDGGSGLIDLVNHAGRAVTLCVPQGKDDCQGSPDWRNVNNHQIGPYLHILPGRAFEVFFLNQGTFMIAILGDPGRTLLITQYYVGSGEGG
jgi:hypothetical protein